MSIWDEYWKNVKSAYEGAKSAKSAHELCEIVNKYCGKPEYFDAHYPTGGDDEFYWALHYAGWDIQDIDGFIHFSAIAPDKSEIEYIEGDIIIIQGPE